VPISSVTVWASSSANAGLVGVHCTYCALTASNFSNISSMGNKTSSPQIERPGHDSTSSTHDTTSTQSKFETILHDALTKYANVTGYDLRDPELASEIDRHDPLDKIVEIFQEKAKEFDDFRNDDPKLISRLEPVVRHLHKFFSSPAVTTGVDLVCPTNFVSFPFIFDSLS
jgi:hypothetical protein